MPRDKTRSRSVEHSDLDSQDVILGHSESSELNPHETGSEEPDILHDDFVRRKSPVPYIVCPVPSPAVVDTVKIASPTPLVQVSSKSGNGGSQGCAFSTFGYGPNGKLEPLPPSVIPSTEVDQESQSTIPAEVPRTNVRNSHQVDTKQKQHGVGMVPDVCHDTLRSGTLPHRKQRKRSNSNGSSSVTSYSETDDSSSHASDRDRDPSGAFPLRTPDLLSPFHSRMDSNTSSGVSSVSQESMSSIARLQHQSRCAGRLVNQLVNTFQNTTMDNPPKPAGTPSGDGFRPKGGQISKLTQSWSGGSTASSGLTGSISDSFSVSDTESPELGQEVKVTGHGDLVSPGSDNMSRLTRGGSLGSYNSQESDLSSLQTEGGVREYSSSTGGEVADREFSSCTSQESDISSVDFPPGGATSLHARKPPQKKNVSFENSGKLLHEYFRSKDISLRKGKFWASR